MLKEAQYDERETKFLVDGFRTGFPLNYQGNTKVKMKSPNLKITIGTEIDLWNKVMKEVKLKRYAGPFKKVPFEYFIQSPIGLVPKDGGKDTRLIFHLSYPRRKGGETAQLSVNANIPIEMCTVSYPDFYDAVKACSLRRNFLRSRQVRHEISFQEFVHENKGFLLASHEGQESFGWTMVLFRG